LHPLVGQAAIGLHDRALFGEACAFLDYLREHEMARALEGSNADGVPDFSAQMFA
jgi:hypothetical protein